MVLPGILASQLFVFRKSSYFKMPLKDIEYVDFPEEQSSSLASAGISASQSS